MATGADSQNNEQEPSRWQKLFGVTKKDANGNLIYQKDPDGNEIGRLGKRLAGITLVLITVAAMLAIIAHWPDKLPKIENNTCTKYYYKLFAVTYAGKDGMSTADTGGIMVPRNIFKPKAAAANAGDSSNMAVDSTDSVEQVAELVQLVKTAVAKDTISTNNTKCAAAGSKCMIDLNTLILLLVAMAGFLGNMIHIGASFTNYVGAGKFKRSWVLWYFVKPFTAAALAVGVYIIFRAGFLNSGEAVASVNLYGVVALAVLAGLYTDMATQKLKEVFAVVFQSSTTRPDPLSYPPVKISDVLPNPFPLNTPTQLIVTGEGFANRKFTVKINDVEVKDVAIKANAIIFNYTATAEKPVLVLYDEKSVQAIQPYTIITQGAAAPPPTPPATPVPTVTDISLSSLVANTEAEVTVAGTNLTVAGITIAVTDPAGASTPIDDAALTKTDTAITFKYTPTVAGSYTIAVADGAGAVLKQQTVTVS
jgi:hypothetical protein